MFPGVKTRPAPSHTGGVMFSFILNSHSRDDERGQGLAEYALILSLIAIVAILALVFLGNQVADILSSVGAAI